MRDRLIELILKSDILCDSCGENAPTYCAEALADYLLVNGVIVIDTSIVSPQNRPLITTMAGYSIDDIVETMKAKEEGRIIVPPCKVGDTVYRIVYVYNGEPKIIEGEIFEFAITNESVSVKRIKHRFYFMAKGEDYIRRNYSYWGDFKDFGTFVFLTREAAEQALKGGAE